MKFILQIFSLLLTWFTNLNATPVFTKVVIPSYKFSFSKTENAKEENVVKIGIQNFARSGIEANFYTHSSQSLRFRDSAQTQTFSRASHPFRGLGRKHNQI
jgi:hypothetical protein